MGIHVGTVATFEDGLMELNKKFYVGRPGQPHWWLHNRRSCTQVERKQKGIAFYTLYSECSTRGNWSALNRK